MNKFIAILITFSPLVYGSMDMRSFPFEIPTQELIYQLAPPSGFKKLKVTLHLSGKVDNEIILIEIDTGFAIYNIDAIQLDIDYSPNLNEIRFHKIGTQDNYRSIYFNILYGVPKKIECGLGKYEYLQSMVKVIVFSAAKPLIEKDNSFFKACNQLTKSESRNAN